jgi:hypothetical protein
MIIQDLIFEQQKNQTKSTSDSEFKFNDPVLQRKMDYAFGHYSGYENRSEAFLKWLMRGIEHSEKNDQDHQIQIRNLEKIIDRLKRKISQIEQVVGPDNVMPVLEQLWQ